MAEAPRPQARVKGAPSGPPGSIDHSDEEGSLIGSAAVAVDPRGPLTLLLLVATAVSLLVWTIERENNRSGGCERPTPRITEPTERPVYSSIRS